jgi:hypothetical protein
MRVLVVSVIAVIGTLCAGSTVAGAVPANGATLARLGQQVDAVVAVKKTKKPKTRTTGAPTPPPREPSQSY